MPNRRILVSSSSLRRLRQAAEHLGPLANRSQFLVLADTRGAADEFIRLYCQNAEGLFGAHRMTLRQVAAALAATSAGARALAPLSRLGAEAIAARSVYACRAAGALGYFQPVADTPGFPRALASTFNDLRLEGVRPQQLAVGGAPGQDLAALLEHYQAELAERSLADVATLLGIATDAAARGGHRLTGLPLFLLDCAIGSAAERGFVAALAQRSPQVIATAPEGDAESIAALVQVLEVQVESLDDAAGPAGTLDRVRRYVFLKTVPKADEPIDASFEFFSAAGEGLEAVEIARRIRQLAEQGIAFDQVAILLRNPDDYLPLVEDALRRAHIPAFFTRGAARPDPSGRAFLALLACASEGLSASRFAEYLSLGQVPEREFRGEWVPPEDELLSALKPASGDGQHAPEAPIASPDDPVIAGTLRAPFAWEKLLVDAAVIGGRDRWARRLKGLENEYRLRLEGLDQEGDPRREYIEKQLERLQHLERFALPMIEFLAKLPEAARWKEWIDRLEELAAMSLRQPESVLATLNELQPMEDVGPATLDEVRGVLTECLCFLRREPPQRRYGRVFVAPVTQARGRSFEVVFLPGLAEGRFPRKIAEDPLLLDEHRARVAAGLAREDQRVARERLLLRIAAGAARSRFVASYPRMDVTQGRPRVPSFYALEIWQAAEGRLPELREMEKRAAEAGASQLGWPAPRDPSLAVDEAEYDLAFLSGLLRDQRPAQKGGARYLLESNDHLARSLRIRWRRWSKSWSEADGIVDPDAATQAVLAAHSLSARSYSPTALQQYAACPYRFLLYAIHQLRPREEAEPLEQLDPLTRGSLFHAAQFELFRRLKTDGLLPVRSENVAPVLDHLDAALGQVAAEQEEKLAPAIPRVWQSAIEEIRTDLRGWIFELAASPADWTPAHFEYAFGLKAGARDGAGQDASSTPREAAILDGLRLRGSIDLIEKNGASWRVVDHKTGKAPQDWPVWIGKGEVLQPVLYGLAAEALLGGTVESGVLYYATQRGGYTKIEIALDRPARLRAAHVAKTIDEAIRGGFLAAAPRADACAYCDYRLVCGPYEERRVKSKKKDRLESLDQLRNIP